MGIFFERSLLKWLLIVCATAMALVCPAQNYLMREVAITHSRNQRVGDLLERISDRQGFYFAYNSNTIVADSLVNVPNYRGSLIGFLERALGRDYEFKETPGYVIVRYAPGDMKVIFQVEKGRGRPLTITGQVKDASNDRGIYRASIYERNALVSTLSGSVGDFKLTIKRPGETIWLTVSKENYRDTTLALLPPVQIGSKHQERPYRFFSNDGNGAGLDGTAFGRFFTSSKQRIQRINLGGFFAYSPYQISLTPGLSSQGLFNSQVVNQVSLNIIGGHTAGVNGVEVGGVFNINQQHVRYFQAAGLFNLVGSNVRGAQFAGVSNIVVGTVSGVQVAGAGNQARDAKGMQLSGLFNSANDIRGIQVAGGVNIAGKVKGVQLAALLNVADSSDYPIGIINLVKNGSKSVTATLDESGMAQLAFRSGGRILYGLVGVGYYLGDRPLKYTFETGLGVHVLRREPFLLHIEVANRVSTDFQTGNEHRLSLRLLPQLSFGQHWGVIAGPTINFRYPNNENSFRNALHVGLYGGVLYRW